MNRNFEIEIDLRNKEDFTSTYSEETLSPELRDYILNEITGCDINSKVKIKIKARFKLSETEKEKYTKMIIREFKDNRREVKYESRSSMTRKILLSLIGILFIVAAYFFGHLFGEIMEEILVIFGWAALGEVAYAILFTDVSRRRKIKRDTQVIKSNVEFI